MIYLDMTSCLDFMGRNPLGIVRVEMNFVRYAMSHLTEDQLTFCYYDRNFRKFVNLQHTDPSGILAQVGAPKQTVASSVSQVTASKTSRFKPVFKRFAADFRQALKDQAKEKAPGLYLAVKRLFSKQEKEGAEEGPCSLLAPLDWTEKDVFVTVGLIWNYLPMRELYLQKEKRGFRVIGMIYDLIPFQVPECCVGVPPAFFRDITDLFWCADGLMTISRQTMRDVEGYCERFQLPVPSRRGICYLGMDIGRLQKDYVPSAQEIDIKKLKPGRFVLQVGTIEPRKNHNLSCAVWRNLYREGLKELMPLVIVGARIGGVPDILGATLRDREFAEKYIIHAAHVSDQTLLWLYQNCYMTIYPSFYEGWGLPVSESLAHGKFCLSGDNGAMKEAGADFAEYLSPFDILGWMDKLRFLMQNPSEVERRNRRIAENYKGNTWENSSRQFFEFVKKVACK